MDEAQSATIKRYLDVSREMAAQPTLEPVNQSKTGATKWVRALFAHIEDQRRTGWTWRRIADALNKAAIPLSNGAQWSASMLKSVYGREAARRAGKGNWRAIKRSRIGDAPKTLQLRQNLAVPSKELPITETVKPPVQSPRHGMSLSPRDQSGSKIGIQPSFRRNV